MESQMSNLEKYVEAFTSTLLVEESALANLKYQDISAWDSVGHMGLMAALEEAFGIEMDIDDIIEFSSFEFGRTILSKYGINMG
jgi:acyl carrier protein